MDTSPQKIQLGVQRILGIKTLQRWRISGLSYRQLLLSGQRAQLASGEAPSFILGKTLWLEVRIKGCVCSYTTLTLQGWSESLRVTGVHVSSRLCGLRFRLPCASQALCVWGRWGFSLIRWAPRWWWVVFPICLTLLESSQCPGLGSKTFESEGHLFLKLSICCSSKL